MKIRRITQILSLLVVAGLCAQTSLAQSMMRAPGSGSSSGTSGPRAGEGVANPGAKAGQSGGSGMMRAPGSGSSSGTSGPRAGEAAANPRGSSRTAHTPTGSITKGTPSRGILIGAPSTAIQKGEPGAARMMPGLAPRAITVPTAGVPTGVSAPTGTSAPSTQVPVIEVPQVPSINVQ